MYVRYFLGALALIGGTIFLGANSSILAESAWKYGHSDMSRVAFGASASVVPWMIAIIPMIVGYTWWRLAIGPVSVSMPTWSTLGILFAWVAFLAYNIANGMGAIATSRLETVAETRKSSGDTQSLLDTRKRKEAELAGIPAHRPPAAVSALIDAEKTSRRWQTSDSCSQEATTAARTRDYCKGVRLLEAELASGLSADKLKGEIDGLAARISAAPPVIDSADPQVEFLSGLTGAAEQNVRNWLAASTPLILEIGGALMYHLAFWLFGWSIRIADAPAAMPPPARRREEPEPPARKLPSPEEARSGSLIPLEIMTGMKQVAHAFFRETTRAVHAKDCLTEAEWHELYCEYVRRGRRGKPLSVDSFRRVAGEYIPTIESVGGQTFYRGRMPYAPGEKGEAAAPAQASTFRH